MNFVVKNLMKAFLLLVIFDSLNCKINFNGQSSNLKLQTGSQLATLGNFTGINGILSLPDNLANTLSSGSLVFANGTLQTGNVYAVLNTTLSSTSTDTVALANGDIIDVRSGSVVQAITVAASATATILGQAQFSSAISLGDASSVLQLGITTPLNQNVTGAGTVKLLTDLIVPKNVTLPSLLNLNNNRLVMFGGTYSLAMTVSGSGFIDLLGLTTLSATWTIGAGSYTIVGNGNVLDLGITGQITFNGAALYLADLVIKNLSGSRLNGTGTIYLSNVTLDLSGNFTRSDGQFYVQGANCKLITNNYNFTMSGSGNNFTVDGVTLWYEQLAATTPPGSPVITVSSATISLLNGGVVSQSGTQNYGVGGNPIYFSATALTLDRNYSLTSAGPMTFVNATPGTPKSMAVDGGGHWLDFPYKSGSFLNLQGNVQLNFANTVIKNFYPAGISYGSSATITYGDGVRLELGADLTIASGDVAWTFTGNAEIDGNGATLTINKSQGITITNAKTLTLKNMRIVTSTVDAFKCLSSTAKIKLQNVDLVLTADFNFSAGSLDIADFVKIVGDTGTAFVARNFEFSSSGLMTVTNSSELFIGSGVNFKYNADPTGAANFAATKRKFLMAQQGSKLTLQDSSIETTDTGLALDTGTIQVIDNATIKTTANNYAKFEFGTNLVVNIASGHFLKIDGIAQYNE